MILCYKCGRQLPDGTKFCKFCGTPLTQQPPVQNVNMPVREFPQQMPMKPAAPQKKKSTKKIIIAIIAVILVIAIVVGGIFFFRWKKKEAEIKESSEHLEQILEESTTKPIVELVCEDYDSDGTYEAYAIVGETDEKEEEHPEFYEADIYFVNDKKVQKIKENVSGKTNGLIKLDKIKYISIEVYEDGTDEGKSFIYTAKGEDSVEADASGKYSYVHQEGNKIVGTDENGKEVEVVINGLLNESKTEVYVISKIEVTVDESSDSLSYELIYSYDDNGLCTEEKFGDETGYIVSQYEYDGNYNMITNNVFDTIDGEESFWTKEVYTYDANGNAIKSTSYDENDEVSAWTISEFNSDNNITKETRYRDDGSIRYIILYEYDSNKNLIREEKTSYDYEDSGETSITTRVKTYEYDSRNQLIKECDLDDNDYETYSYDENGNLTKHCIYYSGELSTEYGYEHENNLLIYYYRYSYSEDEKSEYTYTYDDSGKVISRTCLTEENKMLTVEYEKVYVPNDALDVVEEKQDEIFRTNFY